MLSWDEAFIFQNNINKMQSIEPSETKNWHKDVALN